MDIPSRFSFRITTKFLCMVHSSSAVGTADAGEALLNKLEISGRVPSKDKFRRMACNVIINPFG